MSGYRAMQGALFSALNGNLTDDQSAAVPVFDRVPQNTPPVFVRIGSDSQDNSDTKIENGMEHDLEIHIYSSYHGLQQVRFVMDAIDVLLNRQSLTASGYQITPLRKEFSTEFLEPDGSRGVMRFSSMVIEE